MNVTTLSNQGLLKNLGLMRSLHSTAVNPFIIIPCVFTGPPGWIFLAVASSVPKRRIEKLLRAAKTANPEEAAQYFEAALGIDPGSEEVRKAKEEVLSRGFALDPFVSPIQWQASEDSAIVPSVIDRARKARRRVYASIPEKGQAIYFDGFLEYTLPNTKPLPVELVESLKTTGYEEYTESLEDELMRNIGQYQEVTEIATARDRSDLVIVKTKQRGDLIVVDRALFEYFRSRYPKVSAAATAAGPVLFHQETFVHGYLWPSGK